MHPVTIAEQDHAIGTELAPAAPLQRMWVAASAAARDGFLLRSLLQAQAEIPGRFSSLLPPPSFVRGRSAAIFLPAGACIRGTGFFMGARRCDA